MVNGTGEIFQDFFQTFSQQVDHAENDGSKARPNTLRFCVIAVLRGSLDSALSLGTFHEFC